MNRFKYRKITPKMEEEMRKLHKRGLLFKEIARMFGVTSSTVQYHCKDEYRKIEIERAKKNIKGKKRKYNSEYQKKYRAERYRNDPEFKKRISEYIRNYNRKRYHSDPEFKKRVFEAHKRYREKIKRLKK